MEVLYRDVGPLSVAEVVNAHVAGECAGCAAPPLSSPLLTGFLWKPATPEQRVASAALWARLERLTGSVAREDVLVRTSCVADVDGWGVLTREVIDGGLVALAPVLQLLAERAPMRLGTLAEEVIRSVTSLEGRNARRWSSSSRWVVSVLNGFLDPSLLVRRLPLGAFLQRVTPGFAPCLGVLLSDTYRSLDESGREVVAGLSGEWDGSLGDLLEAAAALA